MSAPPDMPRNSDDIDAWGEYWVHDGKPELVWMSHGRAVFRFGVVKSTRASLWSGPYATTVTERRRAAWNECQARGESPVAEGLPRPSWLVPYAGEPSL